MRRRTVINLGLAAAALALMAGLVIWVSAKPKARQRIDLGDGTALEFYRTTCGTNHEVPINGGWRDFLYRVVPAGWRTNLGIKVGTIPLPTVFFTNSSVAVWLKRTGSLSNSAPPGTNMPMPNLQASVLDENGLEAAAATKWIGGGDYLVALLQNYPRRSKTLHLRLSFAATIGYSTTASAPAPAPRASEILGEMDVPNPVPSLAAPWAAEALPATRETNGLAVTLVSWKSGYTASQANSGRAGSGAVTPNSKNYSRAEFEISENGRAGPSVWRIQRLIARAPTGGSLSMTPASYSTGLSQGARQTNWVNGVLWPEEPGWEVTAEAWRSSEYTEGELWTVRGLRIPQTNETIMVGVVTNLNGVSLELLSLTHQSSSASPAPRTIAVDGRTITLNPSSPVNALSVTVRLTNNSPDVHFSMAGWSNGMVKLPMNSSTGTGSGARVGNAYETMQYTFRSQMTPGGGGPGIAEGGELSVTFVVTRSRYLMFMVKPVVVK